jgi:hypothetical protein
MDRPASYDSSDMSAEVWKPVLGYEGFYEVSSIGRVKALFNGGNFHKAGRILKHWRVNTGYLQVKLCPPGTHSKDAIGRGIHTLVLEAFKGPRPEDNVARHLDGKKDNNAVENLEWGTRQQNVEDSKRHGTFVCGEKNGHAKLTNEAVKKIRELWWLGVSSNAIAEDLGLNRSTVWLAATKRTWRHI